MKILIFIANLDGAGAQRTTINLVNSWVNNSHIVHLVAGTSKANYPSYISLLDKKIHLVVMNKSKTRYCLFPLCKLIMELKPDILFAPSPEASTVLFYASKICFCRGLIVLRESNFRSYKDTNKTLRFYLSRYAYRNADKIIALSKGVKIDLINRYRINENKIFIVNNPVDLQYINNQQGKNNDLLNHIKNKKEGEFHIISIGRLVEQKGYDLLIRAFSLLKIDNIYLTILGEGRERESLEKLVNFLNITDKVFIQGYCDNPYVNLYHSDLFVLSSRWEGFGHVIVEAMACETPVIAFNCNSGPSEIIENNINGILCFPESINELSDAIKNIYENQHLKGLIVKNALKNMQKYDHNKIANEYIKVFIC